MRFGLKESMIGRVNSVFDKYPEIEEVIIYGSRARGSYREGSDIDMTLKGTGLTDSIRSKVWLAIDELNTPYLFDISIYNHLHSPGLEEHIDRVGKLFYRKEVLTAARE
ncbi:nucleotidyltransferase domain-containing protein [Imperialibacter roseus]|uniref:Nucleotidyltransferase domain-containing protein n=1 Tax=Imperialibacter roseus TaxID=1324217 RepID=A0ABZ0IKS5_9BACT|nr:nucleotidyltransferase domain-containing protein [Imperialibacter roseus]WOK05063.1 nucleotidyltransferase domain-containing protein [Imperialibacter roseus]|tara:strand:+ start:4626 stop:4952 length:327 start_codon:yes stop_codon:yes gene_type:complete